jgi:hypothetical protein
MRLPIFLTTTAIAAALAVSAQAAPAGIATITIDVSPDLAGQTDEVSDRDLDYLKAELRESVERELGKAGGLSRSGGALSLVIEDATPNRPTMRKLARTPGLSFESRGVGGATISGTLVTADGTSIPVSYRWYESDFRNTVAAGTWSDAETSFDRFARKLARGEAVASN